MTRKTFSIVAAGLLTLASAAVSTHAAAGTAGPMQSPAATPYNQVTWYGAYATEAAAYNAGLSITAGTNSGWLVAYEPLDPEGHRRGPGYYVAVSVYHE